MLRLVLALVAVLAISAWISGCGEDDPSAPPPPEPTTGTVVVNPSPDSLACTWQLTGPSSYSHAGTGGETLSDLTPGEYTLTWGEEAGWTKPDPASETKTLAAGKTVTFAGTYTVTAVEAVSAPDAPTGPATGVENQDLSYSVSGAVSNQGHTTEYRYDWGDGSYSDWGTAPAQNSWATAGTYDVKAQARCVDHTSVVSGWSDPTTVTITVFVAETVSAPDAPTGSSTNQTEQSSAYTASGAVSSYGDDLQYRFDWGDGQYSTWSASTSASHSWTTVGTYEIKAQARCAAHTTVVSDWSAAMTVTVSAAPTETVSAPDAPGGPVSGETSESLTYTAGGAASSFGHAVEYRFDFGDGNVSTWLNTVTSLSHSWATAGSYNVKVQARCRAHTAIESDWSTATVVAISDPAETIPSPPGTINGVDAGIINDAYEYTVFHSSTTNLGDAIEGQFDWGDGTSSGWIASAPYSATHTWTTEGTYVVKYQARCSIHNDVTASADSLVVTITTTAVETVSKPPYTNYSYSLRNPEINVARIYSVYGGTSSLGHDVETMVDWGDGTQSGWVPHTNSVIKTWTAEGTYQMTRLSRCVAHPDVVSEWSDPIAIHAVGPETISTPDAPDGPAAGARYQNLSFTTRGAASSWHSESWLEYRFDWGDGSPISGWLADTTRTHQYTALGDYEVKAQARCSYPGHSNPESAWSTPATVSIVEQISVQFGPSGPEYVAVNESNAFSAYNATSDVGHTVEYQFDWGDGSLSSWSASKSADHAYAAAGTYEMYYRARCATHTDAVSDWSSQWLTVVATSDPESIVVPDRPAPYLPTPAVVGNDVQISVSGSFSNHGHAIEYQFDYGDGTTSAWTLGTVWGGVYQTAVYHAYTSIGTFDVTCKARCATHTAVESALSEAVTLEVFESIDAPGTPTGPVTGTTGANLTFTTTGTTSSEGHTLEYSFEYRRGTYSVVHESAWSTSLSDDYVFTQAGNYRVRVRARCATHTSALSNYSGFLDLTISD